MANQLKVKASTQQHLDIEDINDDLVLLKTGWVALVMRTTAVNFDLLSEAEQDATIYAYGAFLNSLSFPIEVLVQSKKADITSYFDALEDAERNQPNPDLKKQIQKYKEFIQSTVQQKTVLDKNFYIIITFSPLELGMKGIGKKVSSAKYKMQLLEAAKNSLIPKRDHVIKQTSRLGLSTVQLTTQELIELFYDIYNPAPTGTQRVLLDSSSYTTPIVEPAVEVPTSPPSTPLAPTKEGTAPTVNEQLIPVPPRTSPPPAFQDQPQPSPQTQPGGPQPNISPRQTQAEALKKLQEINTLASQILSQAKTGPVLNQPNQPDNPITRSPDNPTGGNK